MRMATSGRWMLELRRTGRYLRCGGMRRGARLLILTPRSKFATSSRSSTERHGDFSESVVFHFRPRCPFWFWVLGCLCWGFCLVVCVWW